MGAQDTYAVGIVDKQTCPVGSGKVNQSSQRGYITIHTEYTISKH